MIDIPEELQPFLTAPVSDGARRIYDHGMTFFAREDRLENGRKMIAAAIGDAPALFQEAMQQAETYLQSGKIALGTHMLTAIRDGLLLAVEAECKLFEGVANAAVNGRHVLDLTAMSGARYTDASRRVMELNRAAALYIGQLEVLLRGTVK